MEFDDNKCEPDSTSSVLYQQVLEQSDVCDVTVQVGEWKKQFHWCVLVISPFFESIRKNSFMERQTGVIKLNIASHVSSETAILFLYGKKPKLTKSNVSAILELSEVLMIPSLKSSCVQYMKTMPIATDTCIQLLEIMSSLYEFDLPRCYEYTRAHLDEILPREEAVHMTKESVIELFTDTHLSYVSSEVRFSYLLKWSERWGNNEDEFKEVLDCIDLDEMDNEFLKGEVLQHPLVPSDCKTSLLNISATEHRILIFSNAIQQNRMTCFDLDNDKWCGIAAPTRDYKDDRLMHLTADIRSVNNLTLPDIFSVVNHSLACGVYIKNVHSQQTSFIKVSADRQNKVFSCLFTDGDIVIGVKETKRKRKAKTIDPDTLIRGLETGAYRIIGCGYNNNLPREKCSTFFYGCLVSPKTDLAPMFTIRKAEISSCCVNSEHLAGLLSEKEKKLYIYDIANGKIDTIQLEPYNGAFGTYTKVCIVPSEKGFVLYNMKHAVIVSRLCCPSSAKKYVVRNEDLEYNKFWILIKYFYCDAVKSWFRFLKRTKDDEIHVASVSHEHLVKNNRHELIWTPLPLPKSLKQLCRGGEQAFIIRIVPIVRR